MFYVLFERVRIKKVVAMIYRTCYTRVGTEGRNKTKITNWRTRIRPGDENSVWYGLWSNCIVFRGGLTGVARSLRSTWAYLASPFVKYDFHVEDWPELLEYRKQRCLENISLAVLGAKKQCTWITISEKKFFLYQKNNFKFILSSIPRYSANRNNRSATFNS